MFILNDIGFVSSPRPRWRGTATMCFFPGRPHRCGNATVCLTLEGPPWFLSKLIPESGKAAERQLKPFRQPCRGAVVFAVIQERAAHPPAGDLAASGREIKIFEPARGFAANVDHLNLRPVPDLIARLLDASAKVHFFRVKEEAR